MIQKLEILTFNGVTNPFCHISSHFQSNEYLRSLRC